jgi:hypothetical protein
LINTSQEDSQEISHFVYCYLTPQKGRNRAYHNYYDLMYSIRSIYKFYKDPFDITIIGDLPDYINDLSNIKFIPFDDTRTNNYNNTQINLLHKQLIASDLYNEFIDINDDIIFIKDTYKKDLEYRYNIGKMRSFKDEDVLSNYAKVLKNCTILLHKDIINYSAHCPTIFNSELFKDMNKKYDLSI